MRSGSRKRTHGSRGEIQRDAFPGAAGPPAGQEWTGMRHSLIRRRRRAGPAVREDAAGHNLHSREGGTRDLKAGQILN